MFNQIGQPKLSSYFQIFDDLVHTFPTFSWWPELE